MNVVVADDDPDIRELITFKLMQLGFAVTTAADGEAGFAAAIATRPDLVILDVMMPKLTGIEVCKRIRAHEALATTPVLLITAKAQELDVEMGFAAGATGYIVKPFSLRDFVLRVEAVLQRVEQAS